MADLSGATILFMNNYAGTGLGGGEVHMRTLILAAREAGAEVVLACHPDGDVQAEFLALGVAVAPIEYLPVAAMRQGGQIRDLAHEIGAQILHSNGWLTNVVARFAGRGSDVKVLNSIHVDPDAPALAGASILETTMRDTLDRSTLGYTDLFAPVSDAVAWKLRNKGVAKDQIRVIHGSVDAEALRAEAEQVGPAFIRDDGISYVGMVARLEAVKGPHVFARAIEKLIETHPDVLALIGGAGSEQESVAALLDELGISDKVAMPGFVPVTSAVFDSLDIVVVPSLSEGFGIVAAEAGALGKPVIASNAGGLAEVIVDGVTGTLVEPDDPAALAAAISELLDDPDRMAAMGAAAKQRVEDLFSVERMVDAYIAVYEELLAR